MAANEIHLYDIGTQFQVTVRDSAAALDISSACVRNLRFTKPSLTNVTVAASFSASAGSDGKLLYTTTASFLDEIGDWHMQADLELSTGIWHSDIHSFRVHRNL